ncbi:MAG TPA: proprotein convertase P-domain-containing protein [Candidatus Hydrogenedentes bacterium]|nr:proprotein convertase P-domain-containing protein [Candidatus Hydrogenedentota bacterium]
MKVRWVWLVCGILVCAGSAVAEPRILIIGDSWSATVWYGGAIDQVFQEYGRPYVQAEGSLTALGGSTAAQWAQQDYRNIITQELLSHPTIDSIHLMIGGNDILGKIKDTNVFSGIYPFLRPGWWQDIQDDIQTIVNYCLLHPQVKHVVIADYDYINRLTIQVFFALLGQTYDFGGMTQEQVNTCFIEVGQLKLAIAQRTPNCHYVQNFGLLQNYYNWPAGAPHPGVYPDYQPYPGGFTAYAMPDAAFDTIWIGTFPFPGDGLHPSVETHKIMIRNAAEQFYLNWYPPVEGEEEGAAPEGEGNVEGEEEGAEEGEGTAEGEGEIIEGVLEGEVTEGEGEGVPTEGSPEEGEGGTMEGGEEGEVVEGEGTIEGEGETAEGVTEGELVEGEGGEEEGEMTEGEGEGVPAEGSPEEGEGTAEEGEGDGCLQFTSPDGPLPITDLNQTESKLNVPFSFAITDINVTVDIEHENDNQLVVWLESPSGAIVFLAAELATHAAGFPNTTFDDEAVTPIILATAPYSGSYTPLEPLSALDSTDAQGAWTLAVYDRESGGVGTLLSWSLVFNDSCTPPEEGEGSEREGDGEEGEGGVEGVQEGETTPTVHSGDIDGDTIIDLSELLRIIQFYNSTGYHCDPASEDGYGPGLGAQNCTPHSSDYTPQDWRIGLSELLRFIQLYNSGGYIPCDTSEDGFCPMSH